MKLTRLTAVISVQTNLFAELYLLMERERGELTGINLEALAVINGLKEEIAARIESNLPPLQAAIGEVAESVGLEPDAALGVLADLLKKQGNNELSGKYEELNRAAVKVRQAASINREIAERFAATMTESLDLVLRLLHNFDLYGASGGYQQRRYGAVMLNMEA